jgi:SNF2 family DNA or RNA helicase
MLLRLRQICSHPALIQEEMRSFITAAEAEELESARGKEIAQARWYMGADWVGKMKARFKELALQRIEAEKEVCGPRVCVSYFMLIYFHEYVVQRRDD